MKQAKEPGFYSRADGVDVFIAAGAVRGNDHEDVARVPSIFQDIPEEDVAPPKASGVAEADQAPRRVRRG